jgi:hypothetical protein
MSFKKIREKYTCGNTTIKECLLYKRILIRPSNYCKKIESNTYVVDIVCETDYPDFGYNQYLLF